MEPRECSIRNTKGIMEAGKENRMVDSIKGGREVKKSEKGNLTRVRGKKKVIDELK